MLNLSAFATTNVPFTFANNPSISEDFPAYHPGMVEVTFRTDSGPVAAGGCLPLTMERSASLASLNPVAKTLA